MSNTIDQSDWTVDRPTELEDLETNINEEQAQLNRLDSLFEEISNTRAKAAKLDDDGRELVAEEISEIRHELADVDIVGELEDLHEKLSDVVAHPYREAVQSARSEVLETLDLSGDLAADTIDQIDQALEDRSVDQLQTDQSAFEQANDALGEVTEAARTAIADQVNDRAVTVLTDPEDEFVPLVDRCVDRHDTLVEIDEALNSTSWCPTITLAESAGFYEDDESVIQGTKATEYVENIQSVVSDATVDLPVEQVVETHFQTVLPETAPADVVDRFEQASDYITGYTTHEETLKRAVELADEVEEPSEHGAQRTVEALTQLQSPSDHDIADVEAPLATFQNWVETVTERYYSWVNNYVDKLEADANAIEAIQTYIESVPEFDAPTDGFTLPDSPPDIETVAEQPVNAVVTHRAYQEWETEVRSRATVPGSGGSDGGRSTADLLLELFRERSIPLAEVDEDSYEAIASHLSDQATIQLQHTETGQDT